MKIKPDPIKSLHKRRKRELYLIFRNVPYKIFNKGLEVGAGDFYQSKILNMYIKNFICTEYIIQNIPKKSSKNIKYLSCDAEIIDTYFKKNEFDLVFSSNMMQYLVNPGAFLKGVYKILKDDGVSIHCMPNRFWKISQMILHHFNYLIIFIEKLSSCKFKEQYKKNRLHINLEHKKHNLIRRIVWPIPHGAYKNNIEEFLNYGKKKWINVFERNGFKVAKIIKGPVSLGYSLGFEKIRRLLEKLGFCSEYIYITMKKNKKSKYLKYFECLKNENILPCRY